MRVVGSVSPLAPHRASATKVARWITACPLAPLWRPMWSTMPSAAPEQDRTISSSVPDERSGLVRPDALPHCHPNWDKNRHQHHSTNSGVEVYLNTPRLLAGPLWNRPRFLSSRATPLRSTSTSTSTNVPAPDHARRGHAHHRRHTRSRTPPSPSSSSSVPFPKPGSPARQARNNTDDRTGCREAMPPVHGSRPPATPPVLLRSLLHPRPPQAPRSPPP